MVLRVEVHPMLGLAACLLEPSLLVQTTPPLLLQPLGSMTAAEMELARCMGGGGEDKGGGGGYSSPGPLIRAPSTTLVGVVSLSPPSHLFTPPLPHL